MPEKLIIAIDRDDDLGRKTGIKSPVIGREEVLRAAIELATADPEDSDVNTMFGAIKTYDELKGNGENVEVVVICGDENVGVSSDSKIAEQLDELVRRFGARSAVVVTDGSEDEFVLPIISSRFKIDAVKRIVVKQSKTIESTYFMIKRMLDDPKIARMTLAPLGVIFLVYAFFSFARYPEWGSGAIVLVIGLYLLLKAYGLESAIEDYFSTVKKSLFEGRMSFITYLISAMLFIIGVIQGFNIVWKVYNQPVAPGIIILITSFIYGSVWWIVAAGISAMFGKILDLIIERKPFRRHLAVPFLLIAGGLVLWGASIFILSGNETLGISSDSAFQYLLFSIFGAFILAFVVIMPLTRKA